MFVGAIALLLVIVALYGNFNQKDETPAEPERPEAGFRAPSFELEGLNGEKYSLSDAGKPVVINFWASWCGPCRIEMPILIELYEQYGDQIEIYAVNLTYNDQLDRAKKFVEDFQLPFPILLDADGAVSRQYRVTAIPATFFVDRHQTILLQAPPGIHPKEQIAQWIDQLIEIQ